MDKQVNFREIVLQLNEKISQLQRNYKTVSEDDIKRQEEEVKQALSPDGELTKRINILNADTLPWSALAYQCKTGDDFRDMTCESADIFRIFQDGYVGNNLPHNLSINALDATNAIVSAVKNDSCDVEEVSKKAKLVCVPQVLIGGSCNVHDSMCLGWESRMDLLFRLLNKYLTRAYSNGFVDMLINGDKSTTANVNGVVPASTDVKGLLYGIRAHVLKGYYKTDDNGKDCTWTPYTAGQNDGMISDFGGTLTIAQIMEYQGLGGCCGEKVHFVNCTLWNKIKSLAYTNNYMPESLRETDAFNQDTKTYRLFWDIWVVSNFIGKALDTGFTDPVLANNDTHYIASINIDALRRGFGCNSKFRRIEKTACETISVTGQVGFGICQDIEKPTVTMAINIK